MRHVTVASWEIDLFSSSLSFSFDHSLIVGWKIRSNSFVMPFEFFVKPWQVPQHKSTIWPILRSLALAPPVDFYNFTFFDGFELTLSIIDSVDRKLKDRSYRMRAHSFIFYIPCIFFRHVVLTQLCFIYNFHQNDSSRSAWRDRVAHHVYIYKWCVRSFHIIGRDVWPSTNDIIRSVQQ